MENNCQKYFNTESSIFFLNFCHNSRQCPRYNQKAVFVLQKHMFKNESRQREYYVCKYNAIYIIAFVFIVDKLVSSSLPFCNLTMSIQYHISFWLISSIPPALFSALHYI